MRLELAVEWRARRWRRLLDIIDQLPRDSRYVEAVSQDEELAESLLEHSPAEPNGKPERRLSEWSATVELLTSILNRLGEVTQALAALGGAKPRKIQPAPVPTTMIEKLRKRRRERNHRALVARVLPPDRRSS
jgi:hypothetical protein